MKEQLFFRRIKVILLTGLSWNLQNKQKRVGAIWYLPFVCLVGLMFGLSYFTRNELLIGGAALGGVALYFTALAFLRKRLSRSLRYGIKAA